MKAIRYLFPARKPRQKLPLLSNRYTSDNAPLGAIPPQIRPDLELICLAGIARTLADAHRIYLRHPGMNPIQVIKQVQRKRRKRHIFREAVRRFVKLFRI